MPEAESGELQSSRHFQKTSQDCPHGTGSNPLNPQTVPTMCKLWKREELSTPILALLAVPYELLLFKVCQREHWNEDKKLCQAISEVDRREREPMTGGEALKTSFPAHLTR